MKLFLLTSTLFLIGCTAQVTQLDMARGEGLCKDSGGLHHIHASDSTNIFAVCKFTIEGKSKFKRVR